MRPDLTLVLFLVAMTALAGAAFAEEWAVASPGGQLVQAADQWIGVKGARIVLIDGEGVRAPVIASWLRQLGHEACVLAGGVAAALARPWPVIANPSPLPPTAISARELADALQRDAAVLIDLRSAMSYRAGHIAQARWSIRPRIAAAMVDVGKTVVHHELEHGDLEFVAWHAYGRINA